MQPGVRPPTIFGIVLTVKSVPTPQSSDVSDEFDRRVGAKQHLEHHARLQSGQLRTEASVLARTEGDVRVGITGDVEGFGVRSEDLLVAVGRAVEHDDDVVLP